MQSKDTTNTCTPKSHLLPLKHKVSKSYSAPPLVKTSQMKENKKSSYGTPSHFEVIAYLAKTANNNMSWVSDVNIPPKRLRKS